MNTGENLESITDIRINRALKLAMLGILVFICLWLSGVVLIQFRPFTEDYLVPWLIELLLVAAILFRCLVEDKKGEAMNLGGFSWRRLLGISAFKSRISRSIGIPLTRSGRQRKLGALILRLFGL
jgi:hypothetical protein